MAVQNLAQEILSFSDDTQTCAIMSSCHSPSKPIVRLPPLTARLPRDVLFASTQEPVVVVLSPTSIMRNTVNSSTSECTETQTNNKNIAERHLVRSEPSLTSTPVTKPTQNSHDHVAQVSKVIDSRQPKIDNKLYHCVAKLGLGTAGDFAWADNLELPSLPGAENKPKEDVVQEPNQKCFKGLMSSRWAIQEESSPSCVAKGAPKKNIPRNHGNKSSRGVAISRWATRGDPSPTTAVIKRQIENNIPQNYGSGLPKGLANSRWAPKDQTQADKQALGNKVGRELSQHGLRNLQPRTNGQASSRPRYKPAFVPSAKPPQRPLMSSDGHRKLSRGSYRGAKEEDKKTKYEGPGLIMDWDEFQREVKENGLKTLKDSRWAN